MSKDSRFKGSNLLQQVELILVVSSPRVNARSKYGYSRLIDGKTNSVWRAVASIPRSTLIGAGKSAWSYHHCLSDHVLQLSLSFYEFLNYKQFLVYETGPYYLS
jgi:hypothetical protein